MNLGTALQRLGERESGSGRLEQAVKAYRAALDLFEPAGATHYAEIARDNLEMTTALLDQRAP